MTSPEPRVLPKVERSGNITIITFTPDAIRDVENVIARELKGLTCSGRRNNICCWTSTTWNRSTASNWGRSSPFTSRSSRPAGDSRCLM